MREQRGSSGMGHANLMRHRAASDLGNALPTLGKSLTNHQVIPAVRALASSRPLTDIGKAVLSSTGGNPAQIGGRILTIHNRVKNLTPHDKRANYGAGLNKIANSASNAIATLG
tara:strand:+ start:1567 stop:1908 length:342 start_codon:yes stop_codon:yes gene_type:complete